jgi:glutathione S-transferase
MPMIHGTAVLRAEIRRLTLWFDEKLFREVVEPLMNERMRKRLVSREAPDTGVLRNAMRVANGHMDYIDYLLDHRRWLAGPGLSLADFTAAAHLSVIDYLGALDWRGHKQAKDWYAVMKSRPCFRPLLGERMDVIVPPAHYDKVDF